MQLHHSLDNLRLASTFVTIGSFDGVHRGHQVVIHALTQAAHNAGLPAVVITFHPHPAIILRGVTGPFYLTSPEGRAKLISQLGADHLVILPFTQSLSQVTAADFIQRCVTSLGMRQLWVGFDFKLGKDREGTPSRLEEIGRQFGFTLQHLAPLEEKGEIISSSRIRTLLVSGEVGSAANLLGRYYTLEGEIIHGDGRGKGIGIPTANLQVVPDRLIPMRGVYATRAWLSGKPHPSVTNIGFRPTFDKGADLRIETHFLDFDADIYGHRLTVEFIQQLRAEQQYLSKSELLKQIQMDINQARKVLSDASQTPGLPA